MNNLKDALLCPRCSAVLERLRPGLWFCQKCVKDYTPDELAQNPEDLPTSIMKKSGKFTICYGLVMLNVGKWEVTKVALSAVSEVTKLRLGLKPREGREANHTVRGIGQLKGAPKPL